MKNTFQRGEIALTLTVLSAALILAGIIAGTTVVKQQTQTQTLADSSCLVSTAPNRITITDPNITYTLCNGNDYSGGIDINADNVTLDGTNGPNLDGGSKNQNGININGRTNIKITNVAVKGFYNGISISNSSNISIEGGNYSGNNSKGTENSSITSNTNLGPYMDKNVGGGLYFENTKDSKISNSQAHDSITGLALVSSSNIQVLGGDYSGNSGWGVKLQSTTGSTIKDVTTNNNNRTCGEEAAGGCESAGILLINGSNKNIIDHNTTNNSGDGIYLNGCGHTASNENQIINNTALNDSANSIEATFATDNLFEKNTVDGGNYGFWLGYSDKSKVINNTAGAKGGAINIANSRCNTVVNNTITSGSNKSQHHIWKDPPDNSCEISSGITECKDNLLYGNSQELGFDTCTNTINSAGSVLPETCGSTAGPYPTNTPGPSTTPNPTSGGGGGNPTATPNPNPTSPRGGGAPTSPPSRGGTLDIKVYRKIGNEKTLWKDSFGKAQVYISGPAGRGGFSVVMDVPTSSTSTSGNCTSDPRFESGGKGLPFKCNPGEIIWTPTSPGSYSVQISLLPRGLAPTPYPHPAVSVTAGKTTNVELIVGPGTFNPGGNKGKGTPTPEPTLAGTGYTNTDYEKVILQYAQEQISPLSVSAWLSTASRVPGLQTATCYPPKCEFGE